MTSDGHPTQSGTFRAVASGASCYEWSAGEMFLKVGEVEWVAQSFIQNLTTHDPQNLGGLPSKEPGYRPIEQAHDASASIRTSSGAIPDVANFVR